MQCAQRFFQHDCQCAVLTYCGAHRNRDAVERSQFFHMLTSFFKQADALQRACGLSGDGGEQALVVFAEGVYVVTLRVDDS